MPSEQQHTRVFTRTEAQVYQLGGRPDIGVSVRRALCSYVELKAPGFGARTNRFRGRDKEQWEKFKALPNVPYTDSILYRSGEQQPEGEPVLIRFDDLIERGAAALNDAGLAQLHHGSADGKALFVAPDGAYECHSGCAGDVSRASLGLPERPACRLGPQADSKPQGQPTKKGKNKRSQVLFAEAEVWAEPVA